MIPHQQRKRDRPKESHRIDNIVYRWEPEGETDKSQQYRTWWQTEIGKLTDHYCYYHYL